MRSQYNGTLYFFNEAAKRLATGQAATKIKICSCNAVLLTREISRFPHVLQESDTMKKTAWVAGASGLIGGHLIRQLAHNPAYCKVVALVRTPCRDDWADLDKVEQWLVDYESLSALSDAESVDDLFCALGSTTRKTPDKATYHRIDVHYPLEFARLGLKHGARRYALVSAHGASTRSLSGYFKMKGELETSLKTLGYEHLVIARPSLLKGQDRKSTRLNS